jgi:hypothetical protein
LVSNDHNRLSLFSGQSIACKRSIERECHLGVSSVKVGVAKNHGSSLGIVGKKGAKARLEDVDIILTQSSCTRKILEGKKGPFFTEEINSELPVTG